jgi:hypothetical protein
VDPISLIVGALTAGAATEVTDAHTNTVKDAYAALRELVRGRFGACPVAQMALTEHEKAPRAWQAPLAAELEANGARGDEQIIAAALRVLELVVASGTPAGEQLVDLRNALPVGDSTTQSTSVTSPPPV